MTATAGSGDLPDHVRRNREHWDAMASDWADLGRGHWSQPEPTWGIWSIPERELGMFPDDVAGTDAIELGCGTGYVSAWLARAGARPVGIDNSAEQLATARALQREFGIEFPLVHGNAEQVPYPDGSFDFAISEYGAAIWCDPYAWIPEAARLLRPGGRLAFLGNSTLLQLCAPDVLGPPSDRMVRDYFGLHRLEWDDDDSVEFALPYGEWIRLFRANGFEVEDLVEIQAPADATKDYSYVTAAWAKRWPSEHVWKLAKRP
jgi:SAM-dependent methyltransferase